MSFDGDGVDRSADAKSFDREDKDLYSRMDREARLTSQLIKKNRKFYCKARERVVQPSKCLAQKEECMAECSDCSGCTICRSMQSIIRARNEEAKSKFAHDVRKIAREELNKEQSMNTQEPETGVDQGQAADISAFQAFNPSAVNHCWRPSKPCVSLTDKTLYVNTEAVRAFNLHGYKHVTLLYDHANDAMLLDFTEDHPAYKWLTVTHRNSGDIKVSFIGFRKNFGLQKRGKFRATLHSTGRIYVDLNDKVGA